MCEAPAGSVDDGGHALDDAHHEADQTTQPRQQAGGKAGAQAGGQTGRQAGRPAGRWAGRQAGRHPGIRHCIFMYPYYVV